MQTYEILVKNRAVKGNSKDMTLVRTSVGIDVMHVLFDSEEWLGFPVTVTFAQGDDVITQPLILSTVDSAEWVAEAECVIPHEVIDTVGSIRVTFQGTDHDGNHIITAKGSPLSVEEAGDVATGDLPSDVPTVDQWNQAYAKAMEAAGAAQSLVGNLQSRMDAIVADAEATIAGMTELHPATRDSLGIVMIGNGLMVTDEGVVSSVATNGITPEQSTALVNLSRLAYLCFDTEFDEDGLLIGTPKLKPVGFPIATLDDAGLVIPDGTTVTVDDDGMIHAAFMTHEWNGTVLTVSSQSGTTSSDLCGPIPDIMATATVDDTFGNPSVTVESSKTDDGVTIQFAFHGIKGDRGDVGPSGYVLTQEDVETISAEVASIYELAENERF